MNYYSFVIQSMYHLYVFSTSTFTMAGNSISLPLVQMGGWPSPIGPTGLLFYTHFKITFLPQNSVSLPLVQRAASNTRSTNQFIILYPL
ncbi:hypothetical protein Hanom_Chr12g01084951 [Helianthus anomalus]